jgi:hypothetical protein
MRSQGTVLQKGMGPRKDRREVGPSSMPVSSSTTPFTGILGRINSFIQVRLRIKYVCNGHAWPLIKISQSPLRADKKEIHLLYLRRYQYTVLNSHEHTMGEILFN